MCFCHLHWVAGLKAPAEEGGVALRPPARPEWQVSSQGEEHPSFAFGFLSRAPPPGAPGPPPASSSVTTARVMFTSPSGDICRRQ